jgi:hypothetical protein
MVYIFETYQFQTLNQFAYRLLPINNQISRTTIKTHSIDDCKKAFNQKMTTDTDYEDTIFCAQEPDFCKGNAGAPAQKIIRNDQKSMTVLYGMPSRGLSVCSIGFYTNVAHYKDWIMNNLEI